MNHFVRVAVDRRPDVDFVVVDDDFCLVDDHCSMLVRLRLEQVSQRSIPLVDRLVGVAKPLAYLAVDRPQMVQKRRFDQVFGRCVFA